MRKDRRKGPLNRPSPPKGTGRAARAARSASAIVLAAVLVAGVSERSGPAWAHPVLTGIGTQAELIPMRDRIVVLFNVGFSSHDTWNVYHNTVDRDKNGKVDGAEAEAYTKAIVARVLAETSLTADGRQVPLRFVNLRVGTTDLTGRLETLVMTPIDFWLELEAPLPADGKVRRRLQFFDGTFRGMEEVSYSILWVRRNVEGMRIGPPEIPEEERATMQELPYAYKIGGRRQVAYEYELVGDGTGAAEVLSAIGAAGAEDSIVSAIPSGAGGSRGDPIGQALAPYLRYHDFWTFLLGGLLAFVYGAYHALMPGHGKTMVAAYLVGTKGRPRDAVLLGVSVTASHVMAVILIATLTYGVAQEYFGVGRTVFQAAAVRWTGVASGAAIFLIGLGMLVKRAAGAAAPVHNHSHGHSHVHEGGDAPHDHDHADDRDRRHPHDRSGQEGEGIEHGHGHGHGHGHENEREDERGHEGAPTLWSVLSLGISGGIVPCPTAVVIFLVSLATWQLGLGLMLLVFFSAGLGAVLIAIGLAVTLSKSFLSGAARDGRLLQRLPMLGNRLGERLDAAGFWLARRMPVVSPVLVMLAGQYVIVYTLVCSGTIVVNF